jgi:hypothetical protein
MIDKPARLVAYAVGTTIFTFFFYVFVVFASGSFALVSATRLCRKGDLLRLEDGLLPLRSTCFYRDGNTEQLVSPIVNPLLFLLLAVVVTLLCLALLAALKPTSSASATF